VALGAAEVVSVACLVSLWRQKAGAGRKLFWSVVVLIPLLGPLFYGGLFELPSVQAESDRAVRNRDDWVGPNGP